MAEQQEPRQETRSSTVTWGQLLDAADPSRNKRPLPAYRFSNGRMFEQRNDPYSGENG